MRKNLKTTAMTSALTALTAAAAVVAMATPALAAPAHTHIAGADRYQTAALLSEQMPVNSTSDNPYLRCAHVLLVNGSRFADAVTGSAIAAADGGRVLLTEQNRVPDSTWTEIRRMYGQTGCEHVDVVGSVSSVSRIVVNELNAYDDQLYAQGKNNFGVGGGGGSDRYTTNRIMTTNYLRNSPHPRPSTALIATGENYPDALAAAQYTAAIGGPLLLTPRDGLDADTLGELIGHGYPSDTLSGISTFYVIGGTGSVSDNVVAQLKALRPGVTVERIQGADRYETAAKMAQRFGAGRSTAVLATGNNFPDALAAAPFAARKDAVLLLSNGNASTPAVRDQLARGGYRQTITVGAANASAVN